MSTHASNRVVNGDVHPNSIDKSLGSRLRTRRMLAGLSAEQLAEKLRISVDEIRAYESGARRVSAVRLLELARALDVPPVSFFAEGDADRSATEEQKQSWARAGVYLTLPDQGVRLNRAFVAVRNPEVREAIIRLVNELGRTEDAR